MSKIAIVTDTNSSMTTEEAASFGVYMLPMPVIIDDNEYTEGIDCSYEQFFEMLEAGSSVSTSQPSPQSVTSLWEEALKDHEYVIHIPMSSALSSSCMTAMGLAEDYNGHVLVADNRRISILQRQSVLDAVKYAEMGCNAQEILHMLESSSSRAKCFLAVNTLDLLKKSGRVTASGAAIGTLFNIKPVLKIEGDKLDAYAKTRGMLKAKKCMLDAIMKELSGNFSGENVRVDIAYSGDYDAALEWQALAQRELGIEKIDVFKLPISISCHVGAGVMAIGCSEIQ